MADFDVRDFDDDGIDHSNDFTASDEGWFTPDDFPGLRDVYRFYLKHYNVDESNEIGATGTGLFNPFLNMNGDSTLRGFNTNDNIVKAHKDADLDISDPNTDAIRLGDIPIIYRDLDGNGLLEAYYLINLDINENVNTDVSLEELQLFTSSAPATLTQYRFDDGDPLAFRNSDGFTLRFDLDANADNKLLLRDDGAGQGKQDYTFYFPVELFAGSLSSDYLTLFSQFGPNPEDDAGFAEWNVLTAAQISGTKFLDRNGDGVRDADGADNNIATTADNESPLAGFTVYIDINNNNKLDANEQTALTDSNGNFTFASLLPNAQYVIREVLTAADVNGPGDLGPDVSFAAYAPPAGIWEQTTDPLNDGDQVVNVTTGTTNILVGNKLLAPDFSIDKSILSIVDGDDFGASGQIDSAGDQINYRILITNTGDLALSLTSISDMLEGIGVTVSAASFTESGTDNNILDVGETWTWDWTETVSQTELDALCADDETITNTVTATFNYNGTDIGPKGDTVNTLVVCNPDFTAVKTIVSIEGGVELLGGDPLTTADDAVDSAGDKINYRLTIVNTGNVTLDGESITDTFEGAASGLTAADFTETGGTGTNGDGILDVGETWTYDFTEEVSQAELDAACADDETITNTLAATFVFDGETLGPKGSTVNTPVVCNPDFTAVKTIVSVEGGVELLGGDPLTTADDAVDSVGDKINYRITIVNTGNVTLDGESITDTFEGAASGLTAADFTETGGTGTNGDGILDVGETWTYDFTEEVDQAELDAACADDETITNTLAASFTFDGETVGPKGNSVNTGVVCAPLIDVEKSVKTNLSDYAAEDFDDDPDGLQASTSSTVEFKVVVTNAGNVTLSNITLSDSVVHTVGGIPQAPVAIDYSNPIYNAFIDLNGNAALDLGEEWANFDTDADGTIDAGDFAELAPNETFTLYYSLESALGQHENTAVVSGTIGVEEATDSDDANYYVLASHECVGVGTPGFWSNNGFAFWDGIALNEKHTGDPLVDGDSDPGFADGELLYAVDSDGDGDIDGDDVQGLLIGDYDHNGLNNEGDALFIKLSDAQMLINASQKQLQDGKFMLGRDAVATWLNFLANGADLDCIDGPTGPTPKDYLDDAIDWLQTYAGVLGQNTNGGQDTLDDNAKGEPFDTFFKGTLAVKTSSIVWQSPVAGVADDSAATMHSQLDAFNNTGVINGVEFCCDRDNPVALLALQQLHSADYF